MTDERAYLVDLKRQIMAAAVLKEAGRLAGLGSSGPNVIAQDKIQSAVKAYKAVLDEMNRQGL